MTKGSHIFYAVLLCLYVADPATFLTSNRVLGPYFPLRTACLFSYGKKCIFLRFDYYLINIVNIKILNIYFFFSPKLLGAPFTQTDFNSA